jgi:uracil-DNA glycosylase
MTISGKQTYYLNAMGIDLWRERNRRAYNPPARCEPAVPSWQLPCGVLSSWLSKQSVARQQNVQTASSELMVISDWREADENARSVFSGESGALLESMLKAIGLSRQQVGLIGLAGAASDGQQSVEMALAGVSIKVILFMSALPEASSVGDFAGHGVPGQTCLGRPLIPSLHPAYLLHNAPLKRLAWEDLKQVHSLLGKGAA